MAQKTVHLFRLTPPRETELPFRLPELGKGSADIDEDGTIETVARGRGHVDCIARWPEPRRIKQLEPGGDVRDVVIPVLRVAWVRVSDSPRLLLGSGLGRGIATVKRMLWPDSKARPCSVPATVRLSALVRSEAFRTVASESIWDVTVDDVAIDRIPAASVSVAQSTLSNVLRLTHADKTRLRTLSFAPRNNPEARFSIHRRGTIKMNLDSDNWGEQLAQLQALMGDCGYWGFSGNVRR